MKILVEDKDLMRTLTEYRSHPMTISYDKVKDEWLIDVDGRACPDCQGNGYEWEFIDDNADKMVCGKCHATGVISKV